MIKPEDVTIIIPHLQGIPEADYALVQCIISLQETTKSPIIIATNGGEPLPLPTVSAGIACSFEGVKRIHVWDQGQELAVNAAVATTNTPWVFITNNDMIYAPGWFEKLGQFTEVIDPKTNRIVNVKCISPKLIEPRQGAPTFEVYFCGGAGGDFDKAKWLEFAKNYKRKTVSILMDGFNLPFLISKELWDIVGGYDINYDPWGSNGDSDLEYKIKLAGVQSFQNQDCIVYHFSQTSGTFNPENDSYRFKNYAYFKEKWGFPRTDEGIWEATFTIPEARSRGGERALEPEWEGKYK